MKIPFYLFSVALSAGLSFAEEVSSDSTITAAVPAGDSTTVSAVADTTAKDSSLASMLGDSTATVQPIDSLAAAQPADSAVTAQPADSVVTAQPVDSVATEQPAEVVAENVSDSTAKESLPQVVEKTSLSGDLEGFLKADKSPYSVTGDITVKKNTVLIIEPGVILEFASGTGLRVEGQLVVAGSPLNKVTFLPADSSKNWKGMAIATDAPVEIRNAIVTGAENGIVVENSTINLQSSIIEKTTGRGLFAENSKVTLSDCEFNENTGVAFQVAHYSDADIQRVKFQKNNIALFNAELSKATVGASSFEGNTHGILALGNAILTFNNTKVSGNEYGVTTREILDSSVLESISGNKQDNNKEIESVESTLPASPEIAGVDVRPYKITDNVAALFDNKGTAQIQQDSSAKRWSIVGNVMLGASYHQVLTKRNHSHIADYVDGDSIRTGEHYKNLFQTPGFAGEASTYLLMQAPNGSSLEFEADLTSDKWNHFSPNTVTLTYKDEKNKAILGDFQKNRGDIYMSYLPVFGANYTLSLLKNNADHPLFEIDAFAGESQRSLVPGERHPDMYNNYIEDGEAQAQRQVVGGSIKWAPLRRFDATIGALYANDVIDDPILREGSSKAMTSDPLQESFTLYADGNWLFYPGDIELKGQIAMGRADTNDVFAERAINEIFENAGVTAVSYSKLRRYMNNENEIYNMSSEDLEEIFGLNTTMSRHEMKDSLVALVKKANKSKKEAINKNNDDQVLGMKWDEQNLALGASLFWNINKTTISGHIRYVGENYYSVGSNDLLPDTREFGGNIEQAINKFWSLNFGYQISVENASSNDRANVFGLGEGTTLGFFGSASDSWKEEHELDQDRTKYIQDFNLSNSIQVNKNVHVNVAYGLQYRTQYRPYRIHGSYSLEDGIYKDNWFAPRKNKATTELTVGDETVEVDSERWEKYKSLEGYSTWATEFQERLMKHTWKADVSIKAYKTTLKVGGVFNLRLDMSRFENDSLIKDIDLSNKTWSKLGYYFGGANFFEHSYPISATTTLENMQNKLAVTPRFKNYERNNMDESEISVEDEIKIPLLNRFLIIGADASFRYLSESWEDEDSDADDSEIDVTGNVNVRINHTKHLNSEWYVGTAMYYRPENLSNQYKDIFCGMKVDYEF